MTGMKADRENSWPNRAVSANRTTCRQIRTWLREVLARSFGLDARWMQNHISTCEKCQRRFVSVGKVSLALSLLKSQPHTVDLLMRANAQAIGVLKHGLREAPKAQRLQKKLPEPKLLEKCSKYRHSVANVAACISILLLVKIGVFSSMDKFQSRGQEIFRQYYAEHIGQDMADEIFRA